MANLPQRKSIRLKNYNYSADGFYYVTICTQNRRCLFGDIVNGEMMLNDIGEMIDQWWLKIPERFKNAELDAFQIMPNHIHVVVIIANGRTHGSAPTDRIPIVVGVDPCVDPKTERRKQTLFKTIQWFKTMTTNHYIRGVKNRGWKPFYKRLWQRNYYEHIIRTEMDLNKIRQYIQNNPSMWERDRNNPKNFTGWLPEQD